MILRVFSVVGAVLLICCNVISQQEIQHGHGESAHEHVHLHRNQIQLVIAHTHISRGRTETDQNKWLALASWALNYNYHINEKWLVGVHTDLILEQFRVAHGSDEVILERSSPFAIAGVAGYRFWGPLTGLLGAGVEFASEDNLSFARLGIEAGWHFGDGMWEVSLLGTYEFKFEAYNSWLGGVGISRIF